MTNAVITEGVVVIPDSTFEICYGLSNVSLPSSLRAIGDSAFGGCTGLEEIDIPAGITNIGSFAFSGCENLVRVVFQGDAPKFGTKVFNGSENVVLIVPRGAAGWNQIEEDLGVPVEYADGGKPGDDVMVPGFVRAVKSSDSYFDTVFDIRRASDATNVLVAADLYGSMNHEYTQYAYSTYMRLEGGCRNDFKGHYDDMVFAAVGGQTVIQSVSNCETVNGYYRAPTSGWYLVELRVWNCTGPGGSSEGIKYKLEGDSSWQKFEDPGDGSKFRVEVGVDPLPVINNAPVAIGEYGAEKVGDYRWEFYITEHGAVIESKNWENWRPAVTPAPVGDIVVPRQLNGRTVVGIGNYAFTPDWESEAEMNITSIDIPDTVKSYGDQVFGYGCNFEEFEFKEGVTNLGDYVLMECWSVVAMMA